MCRLAVEQVQPILVGHDSDGLAGQRQTPAATLKRTVAKSRRRRDATLSVLTQQFGEADVQGAGGGLHMLWTLPPGVPEAGTLEHLARRARIGLYPLKSAGVWQREPTPLAARGIVLDYGALTPWQIVDGIGRLFGCGR